MKISHIITSFTAMISTAFAAWQPEEVPADIRRNYIESNMVMSEDPCDWRDTVRAIFAPAVAHCNSTREAVIYIAEHMTELTGAYYTIERRRADMNALEALAEKKISCSGQTILMVCAYRSLGIPARACGIPTWNHIRGNHSWPEVYFEGEWHMIEFNEKDFNTGWVMENIGMLDPKHPMQKILAVHPGGEYCFPVYQDKPIPAIDVTERYRKLSADWYAKYGPPADQQRLMVDFVPRPDVAPNIELVDADGKVLDKQPLPVKTDDVRKFATFSMPREGKHYLRIEGTIQQLEVPTTKDAVQVLHLQQNKKK